MTVEPIRDLQKIKAMLKQLNSQNERDCLLFMFGINTGLRISDILPIRYSDIFTDNGSFRQHLVIRERKTAKEKKIKLNDALKAAIKSYVTSRNLSGDDYLFGSKKGGSIGRVQAYRVLKAAADAVGIEHFGTHTMRKSWGYWTYKASKYNIGLIMDMFNHSSQKVTLRYIGISQDQKDELYSMVQFSL
ncbi:integrase family protein [Thermincola ferriacetica]|uniref:Integrase family protein n=1 Tax=Thermincola ferriacetica TaxID=281456 RepID=A0A0L6W418_9FIRM|nr:site-specific integrase [Thermincola ferriacetica]KNZ70280.1 integrase family protein [Thermincola ferriacetica]